MKKRKDGRYQSSVTVTNPLTGEKKKVYVYGYSAAEIERERARVKRNNGQVSISNVRFADWVQEWLQIKKDDIAQSTLDEYKKLIAKSISPFLDDISMKNVTPALIRKILRKANGDRNRQYIYTVLHAIFQQAYIDEIIDRNPCIAVKKPRYTAREKAIITPEIFAVLLENAGKQMQNIFAVAMYTGLRRGEICALRWRDVDLDKKLIKVTSAIKKTAAGLIDGTTKTENSKRDVLISKKVIIVLERQHEMQMVRYSDNADRIKLADYVFTSELHYNVMLPPDTITNTFTKIKKRAGIKQNITFHSFRHTHTTNLIEHHIPVKAVQMRLGHATAAFTLQQYAHDTTEMQQEIIDLLDKE